MATFSRDWNESVPTDNTFAVDIDDYNRYLRVDVSDRLKAMIYGFTAGENDGKPGFKKLTFKQQDSAPSSPNADEIVLYAIDDGSNCGLYAKNEDGYIKQILKKSGSSLLLNIGDSEGCVMKTGTQTIAGAKTFSDDVTLNGTNTLASLIASANLDIGDYTFTAKQLIADVATGTAPFAVSSTTKVSNLNADKVDGYDVSGYSGGENYTFPGGLILKHGYISKSGDETNVTFDAAFPNALISCMAIAKHGGASGYMSRETRIKSASTTGMTIFLNAAVDGFYWQAWGY